MLLLLVLAASTATASDLWSGGASAVRFAGPGDQIAIVCYDHKIPKENDAGPTPYNVVEECDQHGLDGYDKPVLLELPLGLQPVRILGGVKWGEALVDGEWRAMSNYLAW